MGLKSIVDNIMVGLALACCLCAVGCQQESAPLRLSVAPDDAALSSFPQQHPSDPKDQPYNNPSWTDEEQSYGLGTVALNAPGWVIGATFGPVFDATGRTIQWMSGDRPSGADRLLEDGANADNRREGMNKLVDFGFLPNPIFEKRCRQIAQYDQDFTVRATAIRTGNRARDQKATSVFIKGLSDKSEWVRLESAKALANVPDVAATESLIGLLGSREESKDVRVAVADALKHYRTLTVARALCSALNDRSFVVAWQARQSLRYLTSHDFRYDESAWLAYFTSPGNPLG